MEPIKYKKHTIIIEQDDSADSPDSWGNEDLFLIYDHRDFEVKREGFDAQNVFEHFVESKEAAIVNTEDELYRGYYVFPVYAYIHSGVLLSLGRGSYPFNDPWDVSFKGFALVQQNEDWDTKEKAIGAAKSLVNEWNDYLSGNVWGYTIKKGKKELDSCWGFYGDPEENVIKEAKSIIDHRTTPTVKS